MREVNALKVPIQPNAARILRSPVCKFQMSIAGGMQRSTRNCERRKIGCTGRQLGERPKLVPTFSTELEIRECNITCNLRLCHQCRHGSVKMSAAIALDNGQSWDARRPEKEDRGTQFVQIGAVERHIHDCIRRARERQVRVWEIEA